MDINWHPVSESADNRMHVLLCLKSFYFRIKLMFLITKPVDGQSENHSFRPVDLLTVDGGCWIRQLPIFSPVCLLSLRQHQPASQPASQWALLRNERDKTNKSWRQQLKINKTTFSLSSLSPAHHSYISEQKPIDNMCRAICWMGSRKLSVGRKKQKQQPSACVEDIRMAGTTCRKRSE